MLGFSYLLVTKDMFVFWLTPSSTFGVPANICQQLFWSYSNCCFNPTQSISQSTSQPTNQPTYLSTYQPTDQPTHQSINQSINHLPMPPSALLMIHQKALQPVWEGLSLELQTTGQSRWWTFRHLYSCKCFKTVSSLKLASWNTLTNQFQSGLYAHLIPLRFLILMGQSFNHFLGFFFFKIYL